MATRRGWLKLIGATAAGAAGFGVWSGSLTIPDREGAISDADLSTLGEPPATENAIRTFDDRRPSRSPFDKLTLYESGAAEVLLPEGHSVDKFGMTHSALDLDTETLADWDAPQFRGPKVIDLAGVIKSNGPYPSNEFKIGLVTDSTTFALSSPLPFVVPDSFLPAE